MFAARNVKRVSARRKTVPSSSEVTWELAGLERVAKTAIAPAIGPSKLKAQANHAIVGAKPQGAET